MDYIKAVARDYLRWDGKKDERGRKYLSDLKDLTTEYCDLPMLKMEEKFQKAKEEMPPVDILFFHIREPAEIDRAKKKFNAITLLLCRPDADDVQSNHADRDVEDYPYDYVVYNNSTLKELGWLAGQFCNRVKSGYFSDITDI